MGLRYDRRQGDLRALKQQGVKFVKELEDQPWGAQAIVEDLYGNQFVIVQPKPM